MLIRRLLPVAIFVFSFCAFLPALWSEYVALDDIGMIVENLHLRELSLANLQWMFSANENGHYQPLTWITHALDYQISGDRATAAHFNNLLLHAINAILFYFLAVRLLGLAKPSTSSLEISLAAAVAALLFAVHPLRVESVAWATERRDVLSTLFLLASVLAYLRSCKPVEAGVASRGWYAIAFLCLVISLLAKAWGMVLVGVLITLDWYPLRRLSVSPLKWFQLPGRRVLIQKAPFLVLGIVAAMVAGWAQRYDSRETMKTLEQWPVVARVAVMCYGSVYYPLKTLLPVNLAPMYEIHSPFSATAPEFITSYVAVVLLAALLFVLALFRRQTPLFAAIAVYLLFFLPVSGIAQSGPQLVADRYSYLSCMPFALLVGSLFLLGRARPSKPRRFAVSAVTFVIIGILFAASFRQTLIWHDSRILWQTVLARWPGSMAWKNVGDHHYEDAEAILLNAAQIPEKPGSSATESAAAEFSEAEHCFREALRCNGDQPDAWFSLGLLLKRRGAFAEAEQAYLEALRRIKPAFGVRVNLGNLYLTLGRRAEAITLFREAVGEMSALPADKFSGRPYLSLGVALLESGETNEARKMLEVAQRDPATAALARRQLDLPAAQSAPAQPGR